MPLDLLKKVETTIRLSLYETLQIETYETLKSFLKRK